MIYQYWEGCAGCHVKTGTSKALIAHPPFFQSPYLCDDICNCLKTFFFLLHSKPMLQSLGPDCLFNIHHQATQTTNRFLLVGHIAWTDSSGLDCKRTVSRGIKSLCIYANTPLEFIPTWNVDQRSPTMALINTTWGNSDEHNQVVDLRFGPPGCN